MEPVFWRLLFLAIWGGLMYVWYLVWSWFVIDVLPSSVVNWLSPAVMLTLLVGTIWYFASGRAARDKARSARSQDEIE